MSEPTAPRRKGPVPRGNARRVTIYLTAAEFAALESYCQHEDLSKAHALRLALRRLTTAETH